MAGPDLTPHAQAVPAGQAPERIAMRAGDQRALLIDCTPLLADGERIETVGAAVATPAGLRVISAARARMGSLIEIVVRAPEAAELKAWRDFLLQASVRTTRGQRLAAVVTVRVHRE